MKEELNNAIKILKNGGIVIFPTDTAIGIGCRIDMVESVKRVFDIKKRDYNKALLALVDSIQMAKEYVSIPEGVQEKILSVYWPGGLTVFLKCDVKKVPSIVRSGSSSLALRLPAHKDIRKIIKQVGVPILATSANFSGDPTPYSIAEVNKGLLSKVDFVLNGKCTFRKQSTILDCTVKPWKVIRQGAVKIQNSKFKIQNYNSKLKNISLIIDTSSNKVISVELEIDGKEYIEKRKIGNKKTQIVLPMIDSLLKKHKMKLGHIGEIKVNTRPGSFTGLRVGLAIANALSFALDIPVKTFR